MKNNNLIADNKTDIDINSKNDKYNLDNLINFTIIYKNVNKKNKS